MFGRDRTTEPERVEQVEQVQTVPAPPKLTPEEVMRRYLTTPTTFASRRAAREAKGTPAQPGRQLISLGISEHIQRMARKGSHHIPGDDLQVIEVELYVERDHPARRYYRQVGDSTIWPLFDDAPSPPKVTPLGIIKAAGFRSNLHLPSAADEHRPV